MRKKYFKIEYLKFSDKMFDESEIELVKENQIYESNFINVIIGSNGVGKTQLLRVVAKIFMELEEYKKNNKLNRRDDYIKKYEVRYYIEGELFQILKQGSNIKIFKVHSKENNEEIGAEELILPNKILVNSFLISDKFLFSKNDNKSIYKYLGVREASVLTNTTAIAKRVVSNIIEGSNNKDFIKGLGTALEFIEVEKHIKLSYKLNLRKIIFTGELTQNQFINIFNKKLEGRKTEPFWKKVFIELLNKKDELNEIVKVINSIAKSANKKGYMDYDIDLVDISLNEKLKVELEYMTKLNSLDILATPVLMLKNKFSYTFNEGSSGETHILFLITNILSEIDNNSLLLIDEPEISLHPSWIIKFTTLLTNILNEYKGCHVIIATHSHFILSDLEKKNSGIIILKKNKECVEINSCISNTYGWSAENILYEVFGVPSCRNLYLTSEVQEILNVITRGEDKDISEGVNKLKSIYPNLSFSDPIRIVIQEVLKKVGVEVESI